MMPGPTKITLDQASFKALASDVRVGILKVLDERRQTVTDLSNLMGLSKPTLLEHLEKLQNAGLVKRIDEGRKWIYYELTDKGKKILHPERVSIVVALSSAAALAAVGMFYMLGGIAGAPLEGRNATLDSGVAPFFSTPVAGGVPLGSLLAFVLATGAAAAGAFLAWHGRRRRAELFEALASA